MIGIELDISEKHTIESFQKYLRFFFLGEKICFEVELVDEGQLLAHHL